MRVLRNRFGRVGCGNSVQEYHGRIDCIRSKPDFEPVFCMSPSRPSLCTLSQNCRINVGCALRNFPSISAKSISSFIGNPPNVSTSIELTRSPSGNCENAVTWWPASVDDRNTALTKVQWPLPTMVVTASIRAVSTGTVHGRPENATTISTEQYGFSSDIVMIFFSVLILIF